MRLLRSKRGKAAAGLVLLALLFLLRPGAERLRTRVVQSISLALGRRVEVKSVNLRLLPQPGFDLEQFVVQDDPAFGAEPMLRSQEVTAVLRVSSLLRGRLEIARLSFTEPSLNLVRNPEGRWNVEDLLERAARTPVAPTSKARTETRPAFPYIQADRGRINFKFGQEKKPYALTDAEFGLWQDSEDSWGIRLKAQPVRTDFNLSDTGVVRLEGSWQRAGSLREIPVNLQVQWERAQLGQVTKLTWGQDKGWRGAIAISASVSGPATHLVIDAEASVQDFHRYDVPGGNGPRRSVHCSGSYNSLDHAVSNLACRAPVGGGLIQIAGSLGVTAGSPNYDLKLIAEDVPMQSIAELARRAKKNLPEDLAATGNLNAEISFASAAGAAPVWEGEGEALGVHLTSKTTGADLAFDRIPLTLTSGGDLEKHRQSEVSEERVQRTEPRLDIGPVSLALKRGAATMLRGRIARFGYAFLVQGDVDVQNLLRVGRTAGLSVPHPAGDGLAKVDLRIEGEWAKFAPPTMTGKVQLRSMRAQVLGMNAPLEIASANLSITPDEVQVQDLSASAGDSTWRGSLTLARHCQLPGTCPIGFDLHSDKIATDDLNLLLNPSPAKRPWYRFLSSSAQPQASYLSSLHAKGKLTANRVLIRNFAVNRVSAEVELDEGKLRLSTFRGEVLGGRHTGQWTADFSVKPPIYRGNGTLEQVDLARLAGAMHDGWIEGTANASYRISLSGWNTEELFSSADASLRVEARDGLLPHLILAAATGPVRIHRFTGRLLLRDGTLDVEQGKLLTPDSIYQVSGTASMRGILDVKFLRDGTHGFNVTGTLTAPHVAARVTPETQAALKP